MKVISREIENVPGDGRYLSIGRLTDDLQDYIVVLDRVHGLCFAEAVQEISGKENEPTKTTPIGGWEFYLKEDEPGNARLTAIAAYGAEWVAVVDFIQKSGLVDAGRLWKLMYPRRPAPAKPIYIPPRFGG